MNKKSLFVLISLVLIFSSYNALAGEGSRERFYPGVNPHDHINDEGEILYYKCRICHKDVPDIKKYRSIEDVPFYFDDLKQPCYSCHPQTMHPGGSWFGFTRRDRGWKGAPDHWVKPPKTILRTLKASEKRYKVMLPLDPDGEVICATCHNPHERGLLKGKPDIGADYERRWRTPGMAICNYCHNKLGM
ncbi:MAG: hypothetical protein ACE5IH_05860 [Thermodesulfobacteriota bacterium]